MSQKRDMGHPVLWVYAKEKCNSEGQPSALSLVAAGLEGLPGGSLLSRVPKCKGPGAPGFHRRQRVWYSLLPNPYPLPLRCLEFEEDAGAFGFEVEGAGFAVVFAEDAGAHAEAEGGGFVAGGLGDEGIEGAGRDGES